MQICLVMRDRVGGPNLDDQKNKKTNDQKTHMTKPDDKK